MVVEIAYCRPGAGNLKVEFTIFVPAGKVFYRLVDADTREILASATETIPESSTITRNFVLDMPERNLWLRLEVGRIIGTTEIVEAYYVFPTHTWYDVTVTNEEVEGAAAAGDWTSYKAKIKYDGNPMPRDFIVRLLLDKYVVSAVRMAPDVYNPDTFDVAIAFQVPDIGPGVHPLKLQWYGQAFPKDSFSFAIPPGESTGISFTLAKPMGVSVTGEGVEHPQAPGYWTSYYATITDAEGQPLPGRFYVRLMMHTPTPVNVPFENQYLGTGDGVKTEFYTKYKPIVSDTVTVYMDKVPVPKAGYTVDYAAGKITFYTPPPKRSTLTVDYVAYVTDFPIAGVNLRRDTYFQNKLKFAFMVPQGLSAGNYSVWLEWDDQVIVDKKYLAGKSSGTTLTVLSDVRTVAASNETAETTVAMPGIKTSYKATIADNLGNALPTKVPFRLYFEPSSTPPIEEYLKPLKIYVKDTGVWHYAFTKYFKVYSSTATSAEVGFEDLDEEIGEKPDWSFEEPKLYIEVLSPSKVRISVESFKGTYSIQLWYGDQLLTGAVEEMVGQSFETDFKMVVSRVFLLSDVYDPTTRQASISFEVPNLPVGTHTLRLEWDNTVVGNVKYVEGKSSGLAFQIVPPTKIVVTDESVEHPQAPEQWVSYTATLCDADGNPLPRRFYVKLLMDNVQVAGVNLAEDVYDTTTKKVKIAFQVPSAAPSRWYTLKLKWDAQVADGKAFPAGESAGVKFGVTGDVRTVTVSDVALEKPVLTPTLSLSYYATMTDNAGNPLPEKLPCTLKLDGTIVSAFYLAPDIYDPTTKRASVAFKVPADITPGTHTLTLEWQSYVHVTPENPLGTKYKAGSYAVNVTVVKALKVVVYGEIVEHPQAPGQWVSYMAKLQDENGNALPQSFYVRLMLDGLQVGGVNLKPDVYDPTSKVVKIAFQVPDLPEGFVNVKLSWDTQVVDTGGYMSGESAGAPLQITRDIRKVYVTNEWVEKTPLYAGERTSYHATVLDERSEPVLSTFATELVLDGNVVAAPTFKSDIYNPITREASISFQVPTGLTPGAYRVKLRWKTQVCNSRKYEGGESEGYPIEVK
jgi:hypothetical protein